MHEKKKGMKRDFSFIQKGKKRLFKALLASLFVNISLIILGVYFYQTEGYFLLSNIASPDKKQAVEVSYDLSSLEGKSFGELLSLLHNKERCIDGYEIRALALSILGEKYDFHIQKALNQESFEKRLVRWNGKAYTLCPTLSDTHYDRVARFVEKEAYPFTPHGLFCRLQQNPSDKGLRAAFSLTDEFMALEDLFLRSKIFCRDKLLEMVLQADFALLQDFFSAQKRAYDPSSKVRRKLLQQFFAASSKEALDLLYRYDKSYIVHSFSDREIEKALTMLGGDEKEDLCLLVGRSQRDYATVCYANNVLKCDKRAIVPPIKKEESSKVYIVQNGDSLWRISKKFGVAVDAIVNVNHLESNHLKPGKALHIPVI